MDAEFQKNIKKNFLEVADEVYKRINFSTLDVVTIRLITVGF
jgi:hypothetical protein